MGIQIHGVRRFLLATVAVAGIATGGAGVGEAISNYAINQETEKFKNTLVEICEGQLGVVPGEQKLVDEYISNSFEVIDQNIIKRLESTRKGFELPSVTAAKRLASWISYAAMQAVQGTYQGSSPSIDSGATINASLKKLKNVLKIGKI